MLTGDRVMVRSNDDEPLMIGTIIDFDSCNNTSKEFLPIVVDEKTDKPYICFGMVLPYQQSIAEALEKLTPKQQWDWLNKHYGDVIKKYRYLDSTS